MVSCSGPADYWAAGVTQSARKLFAERGFHDTTLADITAAAGKSAAAFYRYYDDKEDLLAALAESFLQDVVQPSGVQLLFVSSHVTHSTATESEKSITNDT